LLRENSLYIKTISIILSLSLLLPGLLIFNPKGVEAATSISLADGVTASLYDAQLVKDESGKLVAYTLLIQNKSGKSLPLIDYWAGIRGNNNKTYVTKLISEDKDKGYVIPSSSTFLTFYAYVDEKDQLTDLKINLIKWDFGANNYERVVGTLESPDNGITKYKTAEETNVNKSLVNMIVNSYKMYSDDKYSYFNANMSIRNKTNITLDMKNVAYYLSDGNGTLVPLSFSASEQSLKPQERKDVLLSATLSKTFSKENASIVVMYKDETDGIQVPKVTFEIPTLKDTAAGRANTASTFQINGTEIKITVKDSSMSYSEKNAFTETSIILENNSSTKINIPKFEYYIKTAQGYLYPLLPTEESDKDTSLLPKIKKQLDLKGEMPTNIDLAKSQFVLFLNEGEGSERYFLGNYNISVGSSSEPTKPATNSINYQGNLIEQISLQRVPNGSNDLLIAEFKVTNKDDKTKAKLQALGQFEIDGVKLSEESTKIVALDKLLAVAPNQSYRIVTYTEIPYIQTAGNIVFSMTEKTTSGSKNIHKFKVSSMTKARLLGMNESYQIDTLGSRGEVTVLNSNVYTGKQSDMYFAQLLYENKEQRTGIPTKLKGYIENSKDDIVELNVKNYETKLLAGGKAVLNVWAVIPKNYEDKKINLYIGESVETAENEIANVIINPVYTQQVLKPEKPATTFSKLPFMNFDISLSSFYAQFDSSDGGSVDTITLDFLYDVVARENAPAYSDEQEIIIEYVDPTNSFVKFSQSFKIGGKEDNKLEIGTNQRGSMKFTNPNVLITNPGEYIVNVYSQYQDHKLLIATGSFLFGNSQ